MDRQKLLIAVIAMTPRQRIERFSELDQWFNEHPEEPTPVSANGPSGAPTTPLERVDRGLERVALAMQIARDQVAGVR